MSVRWESDAPAFRTINSEGMFFSVQGLVEPVLSCLALKGPEGEKLFHKEILIVERSFSSRHWDQGVLLPDESLTALILLH